MESKKVVLAGSSQELEFLLCEIGPNGFCLFENRGWNNQIEENNSVFFTS
ncbi:M42 family peptidase [Sesbania bispinosa]|nr:M42 family peptidase [Sesbania bispinosa]